MKNKKLMNQPPASPTDRKVKERNNGWRGKVREEHLRTT